jgi:hypothetical protein
MTPEWRPEHHHRRRESPHLFVSALIVAPQAKVLLTQPLTLFQCLKAYFASFSFGQNHLQAWMAWYA